MKAKHFRKIRSQCKIFWVAETRGLFGNFWNTPFTHEVLAKNYKHAIERLRRRNREPERDTRETEERWAKYMVAPADSPKRFTKYFF